MSTTDTQLARDVLHKGQLPYLRELFGLSRNALAGLLGTNSATIATWESSPDYGDRIREPMAVKLAAVYFEMLDRLSYLDVHEIDPRDLIALSRVASVMGLAVSSDRFTKMCRTGEITCYDLGMFGIYIPIDQVKQLTNRPVTR